MVSLLWLVERRVATEAGKPGTCTRIRYTEVEAVM